MDFLIGEAMFKIRYYLFIGWVMLCAVSAYGQERQQVDSLKAKSDTTVQKNREMPVVRPDEKKPSAPIPQKKVKENEDGMPVKNFPDSTMKQPER